jgi:hypothetical protein
VGVLDPLALDALGAAFGMIAENSRTVMIIEEPALNMSCCEDAHDGPCSCAR